MTGARVIIKVLGHQHGLVSRWLGPGNMTFLEVASMVSWWIVAFLRSESLNIIYISGDKTLFKRAIQ